MHDGKHEYGMIEDSSPGVCHLILHMMNFPNIFNEKYGELPDLCGSSFSLLRNNSWNFRC